MAHMSQYHDLFASLIAATHIAKNEQDKTWNISCRSRYDRVLEQPAPGNFAGA